MSWDKRIICDVDDTISTHINRDYENAIPHADIIEKLNSLYEDLIIELQGQGKMEIVEHLNALDFGFKTRFERKIVPIN